MALIGPRQVGKTTLALDIAGKSEALYLDLVLELPGSRAPWAVEIRRSSGGALGKGFRNAVKDLRPERSFVVTAETERYPLAEGVETIGLREMASILRKRRPGG